MTQRVWKSGQWNTVGDQYSDVVFYSSAPPPNPKIGDFWYDDTVGIKSLKIWNGLDWSVISQYNDSQNIIAQRIFG
jgi:hypothetical protein